MHSKKMTIIPAILLMGVALPLFAAQKSGDACQIRVETEPADASVFCDAVSKGVAPVVLSDVLPGDHIVSATKQGFKEGRREATLSPGQTMVVKLTLERICGLVIVHSEPAGSDVQVNGADRGKTPLLITDLPLGKYRVRVSRPGYQPVEKDLVLADRTPAKIGVALISDSAILAVESEPAGATVILNGISKGVTPCTIEQIPVGDNALELAFDGYATSQQKLKLSAGQKEEIKVILKAILAELKVVSIPSEARVYVDDQFRGETPVTVGELTPGSHRIRAELKGYEPMARTVELKHGSNAAEEFRLARDSGVLEITTEPSEVTIYVDGKEAGVTKAKTAEDDAPSEVLVIDLLSVGKHEIKLTKKGYFDSGFTVEIEKEKKTTRHELVKRNFVPDYEVRTMDDEIIQGILVDISPAGNVKLEIRNRIFRTIGFKDIKARHPLRKETDKTNDQKKPDQQ